MFRGSHEMHPTAMDWAYRPGGANFLLPVTQFYLHAATLQNGVPFFVISTKNVI